MEIVGSLKLAFESYDALDKYILKGGLRETLEIIGDIHVVAAKEALTASRLATNPRDRINSVITHLETAQASYMRQWNVTLISRGYNSVDVNEAANQYIFTCFLASACYSWLQEDQLARREVDKAKSCNKYLWSQIGKKRLDSSITFKVLVTAATMGLNPKNWLATYGIGKSGEYHGERLLNELTDPAVSATYFKRIK